MTLYHYSTATYVSKALNSKVHKVMEFSPYFNYHALVKIDFSNNSIIEIKKKMAFHGVLM